jgi:hypothetical protein
MGSARNRRCCAILRSRSSQTSHIAQPLGVTAPQTLEHSRRLLSGGDHAHAASRAMRPFRFRIIGVRFWIVVAHVPPFVMGGSAKLSVTACQAPSNDQTTITTESGSRHSKCGLIWIGAQKTCCSAVVQPVFDLGGHGLGRRSATLWFSTNHRALSKRPDRLSRRYRLSCLYHRSHPWHFSVTGSAFASALSWSGSMPPKQKMIEAQRPECPECGMKMIAIKPLVMARQTFECLRCGHIQKANASSSSD